jgi:hypothetical protein
MFLQSFGLNVRTCRTRTVPKSIADVAAGHVQLAFAEAGAHAVLIQEERCGALAVSSP